MKSGAKALATGLLTLLLLAAFVAIGAAGLVVWLFAAWRACWRIAYGIKAEEYAYAKNVLRAWDKLAAAVLGWSGGYTVSAQCGRSVCAFCTVICRLLDAINPGHCKGAAEREGLPKS